MLANKCKSTEELHQFMQMGAGYFVPDIGDQYATRDYLIDVIRGTLWCPKYSEVKIRPC